MKTHCYIFSRIPPENAPQIVNTRLNYIHFHSTIKWRFLSHLYRQWYWPYVYAHVLLCSYNAAVCIIWLCTALQGYRWCWIAIYKLDICGRVEGWKLRFGGWVGGMACGSTNITESVQCVGMQQQHASSSLLTLHSCTTTSLWHHGWLMASLYSFFFFLHLHTAYMWPTNTFL